MQCFLKCEAFSDLLNLVLQLTVHLLLAIVTQFEFRHELLLLVGRIHEVEDVLVKRFVLLTLAFKLCQSTFLCTEFKIFCYRPTFIYSLFKAKSFRNVGGLKALIA